MQPDWEQHYRDQFTPWDKGEPAPPLTEWLGIHPGVMTGRVLVPGCGMGHDVRAITAAETASEVVGLDISPTAIILAREFPAVGAERYKEGDLFDLPEGMLEAFDWVWEHTCFCAIDPELRDAYVRAVWTALRPSGQVLGVFYRDPYDDEHRPGGGPPHGCTLEELEERFVKSGRFEIVEHAEPTVAYEGRAGRELVVWMRRVD